MANRFKYEIIVTDALNGIGNPISVFELNNVSTPSFGLFSQREEGKMYFIDKVKNKLIVTKDDFAIFRSQIDNCYKYWVNIYKRCGTEYEFIYRAYFSVKNMEFNLDECSVEIELQDKSPYSCFKEKKNTKVDVYGGSQTPNLFLAVSPTKFRTVDFGYTVLFVCQQLTCCDEYGCYFNLKSDFFNWQDDGFGGTSFPDDQTFTNYVNPSQPSYYLRLANKSDIKNPTATNGSTEMLLSFADIEKIMEDVFNVYWILEGDRIRFEHYSWFAGNMNYNAISPTNFDLNKKKNKIKFDKDNLPSREDFEMMEANGVDFVGAPIIYDANCANERTLQRGYGGLTTDVNYIINNSSSIANEGIVLIDAYKVNATPEWFVYSAIGAISGGSVINNRLSWANLHRDLHKYGRPFISGNMNNLQTTFFSKRPDIIQEDILVNLCCKDDFEKWDSLVRTEISDGIIDEADVDYSKELIKFKLRHGKLPTQL